MFGSTKSKVVVYRLSEIKQIQKLLTPVSIKKIVIVDVHINEKLKKIIKKNSQIHIQLTESQYIDILKKYVSWNVPTLKHVLHSYDFNLNRILHNLDTIHQTQDIFHETSLEYLNSPRLRKLSLSDLYLVPCEYSLMGLHLLDYNKTPIQLQDKLTIYQSIIDSDQIEQHDKSELVSLNIFTSFIYPYKLLSQYKLASISYNKYISKSLIYINILKTDTPYSISDQYELFINKKPWNPTNHKKKKKYISDLFSLLSSVNLNYLK